MSQPVRSVLIVGRDADAWLAALALHRAVGRLGVTISVLELPSLLTPADVYVGLPSLGVITMDEGRSGPAPVGVALAQDGGA